MLAYLAPGARCSIFSSSALVIRLEPMYSSSPKVPYESLASKAEEAESNKKEVLMNKKIKLIALAYCLVSSYAVYPVQVTEALPVLLPNKKTVSLDPDVYIYFAQDLSGVLNKKDTYDKMNKMYSESQEITTENPTVPVFFEDYIFRLAPGDFEVYEQFKKEGVFKDKNAEEQQLFSADSSPFVISSGNIYSLSHESIQKIRQAKREESNGVERIKKIKKIIAEDDSKEKSAEEKFLEKMGDIQKELQQLLSFVGQAMKEPTTYKDDVMKKLERGLVVINKFVQEAKAE